VTVHNTRAETERFHSDPGIYWAVQGCARLRAQVEALKLEKDTPNFATPCSKSKPYIMEEVVSTTLISFIIPQEVLYICHSSIPFCKLIIEFVVSCSTSKLVRHY